AWKPHRAKALVNSVHTLFTILPFEREWFKNRGVTQVRGVPHPLMYTYQDKLNRLPPKPFGCWNEKLKLLLLPGSRRFEVQGLLPEFMKMVKVLRKEIQ